ncbi:MAG TPA: LamG-like jellyroll fold domain-containing protein, partial [Blastocatellia bacterium]|nr:LamG-like jellyroll fold domain-containing protein [Blastocatellia bacterium]
MKRHLPAYLTSLLVVLVLLGSNAFVARDRRVTQANSETPDRTHFNVGAHAAEEQSSASAANPNKIEAVASAAVLTLRQSNFQGGAGDQRSADLYIAQAGAGSHKAWTAGTDGPNALLIGYELTTFSSSFYTTLSSNAGFEGLTQSGSTVYPVGGASPPTCGASDGVGDTEGKSILARYTTGGAAIGCQSTNFFPYRGGESNSHAIAVTESGTPYVYVTSRAENCGFGNTVFVLTKYDAAGGMINKVTEPGVSFGGFNCIGGSNAFGIASLNGNYYVAGQSNLTGAGETGGFRPVLMKYDSALNRIWKQRPADVTGVFSAVTPFGGSLYAVGSTSGNDYLIEKYDEAGTRSWSRVSGGAGTDVLTGVTGVGSHLFAVGYTNGAGSGGYDAVILEIDPANGDTLGTTYFGGAQDDLANGASSDGTYLYVAGESRSFASAAGNVIGQNDSMLLQFCLDNCLVVTNTNDSGAGSLRQAMTDAAASSGPNNVIFNIPPADPGFAAGVFTISPSSSALPTVRNNTRIDGNTQTIFTGDTNTNGPEIVVNGSMLASAGGFFISGDNNVVSGLVVNGFTNGGAISISYPNDSTPSNNQILNNYVGTNPAGTAAVPNGGGIDVHGFGSPSSQASNNVIQNNLVSGNTGSGIGLCDSSQTNISNNLIGTDRTGSANLGNGSYGIIFVCAGAPNNLIDSNIIAFNGADGIHIEPDYRFGLTLMVGNKFTRNSIYSNAGLGINLLPPPFGTIDGVTPNDSCDSDSGGNFLQNFPVLTSATSDGMNVNVVGSLNSTAGTSFTIEFFANPSCDASGNGEGRTYLGSAIVMTDGSCNAAINVTLPAVALGQFITSTATNPTNNTSEFSACVPVCSTAPTLAYSSPQAVVFGGSLNVSPTAASAPAAYSVQAGHGLTTAPTVDSTGVVSITNAQPSGAHTITIRATDNCGAFTEASFTLNVGAMPAFTIDDVTHNEGDSGTTSFIFSVTKTGSTAANASVNFTTVNGSATTGDNDYQTQSGTVFFLPADTTKQITVLVTGDTAFEPDEAFAVHLFSASGATISDADGAGTITNDDVATADLSVSKADSPDPVTAGNALTYTLTVSNAGPDAATNVVLTDTLPGSVTFVSAISSQGSCSGTTTITCNLGSINNGANATVQIVVIPNSPGTITNSASATAAENDATPATDSEDTLVNAVVCTTPPAGMISWYPADGNANDIAGTNNGTLTNGATFAAGKVNQAFDFDGSDDYVALAPSTFDGLTDLTVDAWVKFGRLDHPTSDAQAIISSLKSGVAHYFTLMKLDTGELFLGLNTGGVGACEFTATPATPFQTGRFYHIAATKSGSTIKLYVDGVEILNQTAPCAAGAIAPNTTGTTRIGATDGSTPTTSDRQLNGTVDELEIHNTALSAANIVNVYNASFAGKCRTCTTPPTGMVSWWPGGNNANDIAGQNNGIFAAATYAAGKVGQAFSLSGTASVVVPDSPRLNFSPTGSPITVDVWAYRTGSGSTMHILGKRSGCSGSSGINYQMAFDAVNGLLFDGNGGGVFTGIQLQQNVWTHLAASYDGVNTFRFYINGVLVATGSGTLGAVNSAPFEIGDSGTCGQENNNSFQGSLDEVEVFKRALSDSEVAAIANAGNAGKCHTSTVTMAVSPSSVAEDGATNLVYTFTRSGDITSSLTANFSVGGTADSSNDYTQTGAASFTPPTGTVTFAAGSSTAIVTIDPTVDTTDEPNETVVLSVTAGAGYTVGSPDSATGTITDDDGIPTISIGDFTFNEGNAGTTAFNFLVTLSNPSAGTITVDFTTQNGSAAQPGDYTLNNGTLTFVPGDTEETITVLVNGDTTFESNETFFVNLMNNSSNAVISDGQGLGTITNDDSAPTFSIDDVTHNEGNTGTTSYTFTVTKTGSTALNSAVNFTTVDGSATTANNDYQLNAGTLSFLPADTTKQITVLVNGDTTVEPDEAFTIHLSGASGATISDPDGTGAIINEDCSYSLSHNTENFSATGGMSSINVLTGTGCTWTAVSNNPSFITVTSGSSGSGNGTVNYSVAPNMAPPRMGTMTIAGITFTVTQDSGCMFTLSRNHQSFAGNGGPDSVNVIATDSACPWTASTAASFIHITSGSSGTGSGAVQYSVDANPGPTIRSDTITIGGHTFTVYQGIDFLDVPANDVFYTLIGQLSARGVTLGCGNGNFCSNDPVTREQMSAFILRAKGEFNPPTPASQRFNDVPPQNVFYNFIDRLAVLQITLGCTPDHLFYCPS